MLQPDDIRMTVARPAAEPKFPLNERLARCLRRFMRQIVPVFGQANAVNPIAV